jgi:hypothetical protein
MSTGIYAFKYIIIHYELVETEETDNFDSRLYVYKQNTKLFCFGKYSYKS